MSWWRELFETTLVVFLMTMIIDVCLVLGAARRYLDALRNRLSREEPMKGPLHGDCRDDQGLPIAS
jgi:hypothetical protein